MTESYMDQSSFFYEVLDGEGLWLGCCSARQYEETEIDDPSAPQKKVDQFDEALRSVVDWLISQVEPPPAMSTIQDTLCVSVFFLLQKLVCKVLGISVQLRSPTHPTRGIPTAVSSLATVLRYPKVRSMFIAADGTKLLVKFIPPDANHPYSKQQYIQVITVHIVLRFIMLNSWFDLIKVLYFSHGFHAELEQI